MSKFKTLDDLKGGNDGHGSDGDDSSDEGRQGFFVGGSERSGQQVLGPNDEDLRRQAAERLFNAVRRAGAEEISPEEAARLNDPAGGSTYRGNAYRLGARDEEARPVVPPQAAEDTTGPVRVRVTVFENGFTVDDGPLRTFEDPTSREFLMAIQMGTTPRELAQKYRGRPVDLHLERRPGPYVPPKNKPFTSGGVRLGSIVPEVVTLGDDGDEKPSAKLSEDESKKLQEEAQKAVGVQDDKPKGQIQIRQPNGQRLVGEFNSTHTVDDVRTFIVAALPDYAFQPFQLHTVYPKKAIEDEKQTVEQAGIFKAVVNMVKI